MLKYFEGMKSLCCSEISTCWPILTRFRPSSLACFCKKGHFGPFWMIKARFRSFDDYNWLNMAWYVSPWVAFGEYQWYVGISMGNNHDHHTWHSKLGLNGQFWLRINLIWATLGHSMVGSLWSGTSHNMKKLAKPHQHVQHEILTPLSPKISFIRPIVLVLLAF